MSLLLPPPKSAKNKKIIFQNKLNLLVSLTRGGGDRERERERKRERERD
jgi:hypothetical protein